MMKTLRQTKQRLPAPERGCDDCSCQKLLVVVAVFELLPTRQLAAAAEGTFDPDFICSCNSVQDIVTEDNAWGVHDPAGVIPVMKGATNMSRRTKGLEGLE